MSDINDPLANIIDAYLAFLEGDGDPPSLDGLDAHDRAEANARIELLEALRGADLPQTAVTDDPVARRFGFDRAGQDITVNGIKIAALRKLRKIQLKDLVAMVNNGGGSATAHSFLNLEQQTAAAVPQHTASALAAALRVSVSDFESADLIDLDAVPTFLASPEFDELVATWAAEHNRVPEQVRRQVNDRMLAVRFRAAHVTAAHLLDIARAILRGLEP